MGWWQLWDRAALAAQAVTTRRDSELMWWAGLVCLALVAVGAFFALKLAFDRPRR